MGVVTIVGCFVCLCMGELAALWPHRTGGMPSYASERSGRWSATRRPSTSAASRAGATGWAGSRSPPSTCCWPRPTSPCCSTSPPGHTIAPLGTPGARRSASRSSSSPSPLLLASSSRAYLGIRLGATFATVLGVLSMVPLTAADLPAVLQARPLPLVATSPASTPPRASTSAPRSSAAWIFVILWNVIAMEAAACYVGECRDGARDAKIALTAEGLYGVFVYIATALVFVAVLGPVPDERRPAHPVHELHRPHLRARVLGAASSSASR